MPDNAENRNINPGDSEDFDAINDIDNSDDTNMENDMISDFSEDDFDDDFSYEESYSKISSDNQTSALDQVNVHSPEIFKSVMKKTKKNIIIILAILFVISLALYITGIATLPHDTVIKNVYVEDVYVGGMTYDEVLAAMEKTFLLENKKIIVTCNGQQTIINGNDIGMAANPVDTAKKVYNYGKSGNLLADGLKNALCLIKKHIIIPVAEINQELLTNKLTNSEYRFTAK